MVDWPTVIASVSLSVVGSLIVTEFQLRRKQSIEESAEVTEWYEECYGYASQVERDWSKNFGDADGQNMNLEKLQSRLSLLETQISQHASEGEKMEMDEEVISRLDSLAEECHELANRSLHLNSNEEFSESEDDLLGAVEELENAVNKR